MAAPSHRATRVFKGDSELLRGAVLKTIHSTSFTKNALYLLIRSSPPLGSSVALI